MHLGLGNKGENPCSCIFDGVEVGVSIGEARKEEAAAITDDQGIDKCVTGRAERKEQGASLHVRGGVENESRVMSTLWGRQVIPRSHTRGSAGLNTNCLNPVGKFSACLCKATATRATIATLLLILALALIS